MTNLSTTVSHCIRVPADKWSPYRQMAVNVFNAFPTLALGVEQVDGVARAVYGLPADGSLKDALSFLVRNKQLRRRRSDNGTSLYEINLYGDNLPCNEENHNA
jgi:hypothetical protein